MKSIFSTLADIVPGFRTRKVWKMIIAFPYYAFALMMLMVGGAWETVLIFILPFLFFSFFRIITNKNNMRMPNTFFTLALVGMLIISIIMINREFDSSMKDMSTGNTPSYSMGEIV